MYEVEVKVPADHDSVRPELRERDATRTTTVHHVDTYYDAPHREFAETDEALRIRTEESPGQSGTARLAYKGPLVDEDSKTREESETDIESREVMDDILDNLGFSPAAVVEKDRERYALDEYTVMLDTVADLGEFVEIEIRTERETTIETARNGVFSLLRDLGFDPADQIRSSYLALLDDNHE